MPYEYYLGTPDRLGCSLPLICTSKPPRRTCLSLSLPTRTLSWAQQTWRTLTSLRKLPSLRRPTQILITTFLACTNSVKTPLDSSARWPPVYHPRLLDRLLQRWPLRQPLTNLIMATCKLLFLLVSQPLQVCLLRQDSLIPQDCVLPQVLPLCHREERCLSRRNRLHVVVLAVPTLRTVIRSARRAW